MPDYPSILQDFVWQLDDHMPGFPRVKRFLDHWRTEIRAPIAEVNAAVLAGGGEWRAVDSVWLV